MEANPRVGVEIVRNCPRLVTEIIPVSEINHFAIGSFYIELLRGGVVFNILIERNVV